MSHGVRGRGVIDLRKRKPGAAQERARTMRLELPVHRRTSLRTRRRKLQVLLALVLLVVGAGAVYGLSEVTYMPRYAIKEVSVEGTENVSPRLVRAFVETKINDGSHHLLSRENIFLYPKAYIAKSISGYFPRILNAQISRDALMAQVINVVVVERKPFAIWCEEAGNRQKAPDLSARSVATNRSAEWPEGNRDEKRGGGCFEMDSSGFIFAPSATSSSADEVVFTGGLATNSPPIGQTFLPQRFESVLALLARLKDEGFPATDVSVENEQDFAVSLAEGFVLRASFDEDAHALVRNLQAVLSSDSLREKDNKIEYIDLRFGNRVYYRNKN